MNVFYILHIICLLVAIAFYTLSERKLIASIQRRQGPHIVGAWGLLQPLADGLKVLVKHFFVPRNANINVFIFAPFYVFGISLIV
jgi:NADH-quinone oxidoreductase subunit H